MVQEMVRPRFIRAGGFDQPLIERGEDLCAAVRVDKKLWAALSLPVEGVEFDRRTLELLDRDADGFIRAPEFIDAVEWVTSLLTDLSEIGRSSGVRLSSIDTSTEEGRRVRDAAVTILSHLGKGDAAEVTLDDCLAREEMLSKTRFNGDGVITAASTDDQNIREWIEVIVGRTGGCMDRSGVIGIDGEMIDSVDGEITAHLQWLDARPVTIDRVVADDHLELFLDLYPPLREKIDDHFLRCRLAAYDDRTTDGLAGSLDRVREMAGDLLPRRLDEIAALPLAPIGTPPLLDLDQGVNPAWSERLDCFRRVVLSRSLELPSPLSEEGWNEVKKVLDPLFG